MWVIRLTAVPLGSIEYRLRQMPSIGRVEEKCSATCASLLGCSVVYHASRGQWLHANLDEQHLRIRLKNCQAGITTSFLTLYGFPFTSPIGSEPSKNPHFFSSMYVSFIMLVALLLVGLLIEGVRGARGYSTIGDDGCETSPISATSICEEWPLVESIEPLERIELMVDLRSNESKYLLTSILLLKYISRHSSNVIE